MCQHSASPDLIFMTAEWCQGHLSLYFKCSIRTLKIYSFILIFNFWKFLKTFISYNILFLNFSCLYICCKSP
jgi:hypothetical protein